MKKIKILTVSDNPIAFSGVAGQTKYMIEALLQSGKFEVVSLAGAIKHKDYNPIKTEEHGDDWILYPVDGFGTAEIVRYMLRNHKPDIVWVMSDPRMHTWLWTIENEIRAVCPIVYYHVWDNYPYPKFNTPWYESNDMIVSISKITSDIVRTVSPSVEETYLPHAVDPNVFRKLPEEEIKKQKDTIFEGRLKNKFVFFWNNRNARRKHSTTLVWWFLDFLEKHNLKDKICLLMHTDPRDEHGTDIPAILKDRNATNGEILISAAKLPPEHVNVLYNIADCTVSISDAEGYGLSLQESLATSTPIIATETGGMQEQVKNSFGEVFGVSIKPSSKMLVGSLTVPYILEDRISQEDFEAALMTIYSLPKEELQEMGKRGKQHSVDNYNFDTYRNSWVKILEGVHEKFGSWETRKNHKSWRFEQINFD
jgi:glycosyltransferase involved in cell wall biosynthesis